MKKLYLVDVSSMYFRAFYAIRALTNSKGMPTNALYGFLSMTIKLLREIRPDYMAFCFDNKAPSFRVALDPRYKANRTEMPEDLQKQVPYVRALVDALGIPAFEVPGYEADDIIGTLTRLGRKNNLEVFIVSGDKDFGQLVTNFVSIQDPMKEITLGIDGIQEKFGVHPDQVIDYLAIVGDSSDNVPGVRGIGPKGAQKLLAQFPTLEEIYANLDKVKPESVAKKLSEHKEEAFLSRKLVTIVTDMDLKVSLDDLKMKPIDRAVLQNLLQELEFKSIERSLLGETRSTAVNSQDQALEEKATKKDEQTGSPVNQQTEKQKLSAADFTKDLKTISPRIHTEYPEYRSDETRVSLSEFDRKLPSESEVWALWTERGLSFAHEHTIYTVEADTGPLSEVLSKKKIKWKGWDLKEFWKTIKIKDPKSSWDHMLAAYVLKSQPVGEFRDVYTAFVGEKFTDLPSLSQWHQAHMRLQRVLQSKLEEQNALQVYCDIEVPLIPVLYCMEERGVLLDLKRLKKESVKLADEIRELEGLIHKEVGEVFNISSPKQLGHILFDKLKMPAGRKTKTGYSTDSAVLEKLSGDFPIASKILEYRELVKLKSTYVDALPLLVRPETGRLHTTFNQAVTSTGRLSSTNPNLQNIPIRTPRGSAIRAAFVAEEGYQLISADYSQIELRILAHITGDESLRKAFAENLDIHTATAAEVFGVKLDQVTPELRRTAKAVNFGIAYGMSAFGLAERLELPRKEASEIIQRYFTRFRRVQDYMTSTVEEGKKKGYVETIFGRRRYVPELFSKNSQEQKFGERAAINAPIQGSASDIVKKAMIEIAKSPVGADLILQVHDELVFEDPRSRVKSDEVHVKKVMEEVVKLDVPLVVQVHSGSNWEEAH